MTWLADVRHGFRLIGRNPGFAIVAVLSLAVGIGGTTAVFSLTSALLLRPVPAERPEELVSIFTSDFSGPPYGASSYPDYVDMGERTQVFSGIVAYNFLSNTVTLDDRTERATASIATRNYFSVLGIPLSAGRPFAPEESANAAVVVVSDAFASRLRPGTSILGERLVINSQSFDVIGVAPPGFRGVEAAINTDFWIPVEAVTLVAQGSTTLTTRGSRGWRLMGRLAPGHSIEEARASFEVLAAQLAQSYPDSWFDVSRQPRRVTLVPAARLVPQLRPTVSRFMALLMLVVALVLLIACANVANLLLTRAAGRIREIAVRLALGASRVRLVGQLLTESLVLSIVAGAAGVALAVWITRAIAAFTPPVRLPFPLDPSVDWLVLLFASGLSVLTGVMFGLVPALQATRPDLTPALKASASTHGGRSRIPLSQALVVVQVSLSLLLLVAAGLLMRTLQESQSIRLGFDPEGVVVASVDLVGSRMTPEQNIQFFQSLVARLRQIPGAESASLAAFIPLGLTAARRAVRIEGYEARAGEDMEQHVNFVSPDHFETMGIRVVRGRAFTDQDRAGSPLAAMVNQAFARRFWGDADPIGKRISASADGWAEVVGVTEDGRYVNVVEEAQPYLFLPLWQNARLAATAHVRSGTRDAAALIPEIRRAVGDTRAGLPVFDEGLLSDKVAIGSMPTRLAASWLAGFGALATFLAVIGLSGVLGHAVSLRRREIGVRMALGADRRTIEGMFVRQGLRMVLVGLCFGLAGAFAVTRLMASLLYGVSATDPLTFAATALLVGGVALAATYLPARRAARLDPIQVLRAD